MGKLKKIIYNCREATLLIEKSRYKPLSLKERIKLHIHLYGCAVCRLFRRQSRIIDRAMRMLFHTNANSTRSLDESTKREMQEKINERIPH
jgi:hypothetical protein